MEQADPRFPDWDAIKFRLVDRIKEEVVTVVSELYRSTGVSWQVQAKTMFIYLRIALDLEATTCHEHRGHVEFFNNELVSNTRSDECR